MNLPLPTVVVVDDDLGEPLSQPVNVSTMATINVTAAAGRVARPRELVLMIVEILRRRAGQCQVAGAVRRVALRCFPR